MKRVMFPILVAALAAFTVGCKTIQTIQVSPATVQLGVASGVQYAIAKYPVAVPYIKAATPIICSAANGTNLAPAQVVAALEGSSAAVLKTPEAVLIMNGALTFYVSIWESYGAAAVSNAPALQGYLQATCNGLTDGLGTTGLLQSKQNAWPLIKMP